MPPEDRERVFADAVELGLGLKVGVVGAEPRRRELRAAPRVVRARNQRDPRSSCVQLLPTTSSKKLVRAATAQPAPTLPLGAGLRVARRRRPGEHKCCTTFNVQCWYSISGDGVGHTLDQLYGMGYAAVTGLHAERPVSPRTTAATAARATLFGRGAGGIFFLSLRRAGSLGLSDKYLYIIIQYEE